MAARPLPPLLDRFLTGLYEHKLARLRARERPDAALPRDPTLLIGGLTGILDVYGTPSTGVDAGPQKTGARPDQALAEEVLRQLRDSVFDEHLNINLEPERREALASVAPQAAGRLMIRALDELEKRVQAQEATAVVGEFDTIVSNAMVHFAATLAEPIRIPIMDLAEHSSER